MRANAELNIEPKFARMFFECFSNILWGAQKRGSSYRRPPGLFLFFASTCQTRVCRKQTLCSLTDLGQAGNLYVMINSEREIPPPNLNGPDFRADSQWPIAYLPGSRQKKSRPYVGRLRVNREASTDWNNPIRWMTGCVCHHRVH